MKTRLTLFFLLAAFSLHAQMQFVAPLPNTAMQNPERIIVLRPGTVLDASTVAPAHFSVVGSKSGNHALKIILALDDKTINLRPLQPFAFGEKVTVEMKSGVRNADGSMVSPYSFSFYIHREYTQQEEAGMATSLQQIRQLEMTSAQEGNEPAGSNFTVTVNTNPTAGQVFFGNDAFTTSYYKYTIENNGTIDYSLKGSDFWDWRINHNNYLTDFNKNSFEMLDSNYVQIQTMGTINGYPTDIHECQIFPDGHYFIIGDDTRIIDMTVFNSTTIRKQMSPAM